MAGRSKIFLVLCIVMVLLPLIAVAAHASTLPPGSRIGGIDSACSRTQPEYLIHAGGARVQTFNGRAKFNSWFTGGLNDPYISTGYESDLNSSICNSIGYHRDHGSRSFALPVKLGRQGRIYSSAHDITSRDFIGNASYDMWFSANPNVHTYPGLVNGGSNTTEVMIWLSSTGLPRPRNYSYHISGHRWGVIAGFARNGHGRTAHRKGWDVIGFISPDHHNGSVYYRNLNLNSFITEAIKYGALKRHDYIMAIDQGFEMWNGSASVTGYTLTGVK